MPPKRGTKAYDNEYVYAHYGINMNTLAVQSVWETRGGTLSNGNGYSHSVMAGRQAKNELVIVFNLTDIRSLPISMVESQGAKITAELEAIAAQKRAEKDAKKEN